MNMPPPAPQGQPGQPPGQPQGDPSQQQGQNPIIQCLQILGQYVQRLAQRDPQAAKAAGEALNQFIEVIKGEGQKQPGQPAEAEGGQEDQGETPAPAGKKKMGPMPMNAKKGAVQVL